MAGVEPKLNQEKLQQTSDGLPWKLNIVPQRPITKLITRVKPIIYKHGPLWSHRRKPGMLGERQTGIIDLAADASLKLNARRIGWLPGPGGTL
jgi:hypothetical protein